MQKPKIYKYLGSICFFVASLILGACAFCDDHLLLIDYTNRDLLQKLEFPKAVMRFINKLLFCHIKWGSHEIVSVHGWISGSLFAVLIIIAFLFIIIGFLSEKKRYITIGAIFGIVTQCLNCLGLLYSIERLLLIAQWDYNSRYVSRCIAGPGLPFELLLVLFFVALLLCSLSSKHGLIYGVIGTVLILVRLIPAGYICHYGSYIAEYAKFGISRFSLNPWAIVVSVLFALGSLLLGFYFAPFSVKKANKHNASMKGATKIDKIVRLKELLDVGAITQEEFDAKKKEIIER